MARAQSLAEWLLLAIFAALFCLHTVPNAWRTLNTDFPNYYLAAQLAHEGVDMSQAYDWRWFQREKDQRNIDQRLVGLAPITPFSTLFVWPLTRFTPLKAKHVWLLLQLALLVPIGLGLRALTGQPLRRLALLAAACFPLHRNLLYGQFYILLLAILVAACWAYTRRLSVVAGALIAIAAMAKIFPVIFAVYFLRKRDWKALCSLFVTVTICLAVVVPLFGWSIHRLYLLSILPWALRGEALPPYELASASISSVLHRLFLFEPQWNPHPWRNMPWLAATLAPVLQMVILAPAVLLIQPRASARERDIIALEWSSLLCATLTVSTSPASYDFTLLLLPLAVLMFYLLPDEPLTALAAVALFLGIGYPGWHTANVDGLRALIHVPRLILLILLTALCCRELGRRAVFLRAETQNAAWVCALTLVVAVEVVFGIYHQRNLYDDYRYRLPMPAGALLAGAPAAHNGSIEMISMLAQGYRLTVLPAIKKNGPTQQEQSPTQSAQDQLSFATNNGGDWIEEAGIESKIVPPPSAAMPDIENAYAPVLSPDGRLAAYLRTERGRTELFSATAQRLSPATINVLEAAYLREGTFVIAGSERDKPARLYAMLPLGKLQPLAFGETRYPAVSPDRQWLAYSRFEAGSWNLWLLNFATNMPRRLTRSGCDQVEASWEADSKTLLYASDCGRALGLYAICRRKVIP